MTVAKAKVKKKRKTAPKKLGISGDKALAQFNAVPESLVPLEVLAQRAADAAASGKGSSALSLPATKPAEDAKAVVAPGAITTKVPEVTINNPELPDFLDKCISVEFINDAGTFKVNAVSAVDEEFSIFIFFNIDTVQFIPAVGSKFDLVVDSNPPITVYYPGTTATIPELGMAIVALIKS